MLCWLYRRRRNTTASLEGREPRMSEIDGRKQVLEE